MTPRPKILVVDDTPANLLVMRKLLAKVEAEVVCVASGAEGLSACLDAEFALILLDVNMPEMDGFEVAELIAEEEKNKLTPIVFVTAAYADDLNRLKGYHAGAVDYIAKPINDQMLLSKVRVFLELWSARQDLRDFSTRLNERNRQLEHEIKQREIAEAAARHQAHHDPLTGLPNRLLFRDRIGTAMQRTTRDGARFALLYVDIDGFKPVNDTHGHGAGDVLLQQIGVRLRESVRASDTAARLGGDEFALLLEEVHSAEEAQQIGEQIVTRLRRPFELGAGLAVNVGASVGLALFPDHAQDRDALMTAADGAMYRAKRGASVA